MDMCIQKCVGSKREDIHEDHKGRSRRNAHHREDNYKGMVKLKYCMQLSYFK